MTQKVVKTDAQWRAQLSDQAYKVARKGATEPAFSHENFPDQAGVFQCICCGAYLFDSIAKFDSGSGWPSFFAPLSEEKLGHQQDNSWFTRRTEVHCNTCNAHLGHVFNDGPEPTGLRYCINGVALTFSQTEDPQPT